MKNEIAQLTVQESRERLTKDSVILIPMGSLEDQGVHAPMGDYLAAKLIADRIAQSATKAGVPTHCTPVIPFGAEDFFGLSHGGIALRPTTLAALLDDLIASLERHGLRRLVFINGHGGNVPVLSNVSIHWRRNKNLFITSLYLWQMAYGILKEILPDEEAKLSSGHGADPLTSVGLYLYPELLRMDLAKPPPASAKVKGVEVGGFGYFSYMGVPVQAPIEAAEVAPDGIWGGSPLRSSAERGEILVDRLVSIATSYIRDHVATDFGAK